MKVKNLISLFVLSLLASTLLAIPVLAQYNITLTLKGPEGQIYYTKTFESINNMTLAIPKDLYTMIVEKYETDTFTAPFEIVLITAGWEIWLTLEGVSEPPGWTVTFAPMEKPDLDSDGKISIRDLVILALKISSLDSSNYDMFLDVKFDLVIDVFDLVKVAKEIAIIP
ncbi:MAG: hypothetical protein QW270_08175 [Candidatus Bathyarchaeia archaeon]